MREQSSLWQWGIRSPWPWTARLSSIKLGSALQLGDVNKVVPVDKSSTVLTILLALIFLHEGINVPKAAAAAMIAAGIYLMIEKKDKRIVTEISLSGTNIRCAFSCLLTGCLI